MLEDSGPDKVVMLVCPKCQPSFEMLLVVTRVGSGRKAT